MQCPVCDSDLTDIMADKEIEEGQLFDCTECNERLILINGPLGGFLDVADEEDEDDDEYDSGL